MMRLKKTLLAYCTSAIAVCAIPHANAEDVENDKLDIVTVAMASEDLTTFVKALKAADLVGTLQTGGTYTVFAPTNDAFDALPDGTLAMLLKPENKEKLAAILKYHVVKRNMMSMDMLSGGVDTLNGTEATIDVGRQGVITIDGATITAPNIEAKNGVIHIIDEVIMPEE